MSPTVYTRLLGAALLALSTSGSMAGTLSLASHLDNVKVGVIDLTPNDGVAAAFTVASMRTDYSQLLSRSPQGAGPGQSQSWSESRMDSAPFTYTHSLGWGSVTGSTTGQVGGLSLVAGVDDASGFSGSASSRVQQSVALNLAPHTIVTFSGTFARESDLTGALPSTFARINEIVTLRASDGTESNFRNDFEALEGGPLNSPFWFAMANPHDTAMTVNMVVTIGAYVAQTSLVPEPSTYAMLGLGLLTVGAFARRRRAQQA